MPKPYWPPNTSMIHYIVPMTMGGPVCGQIGASSVSTITQDVTCAKCKAWLAESEHDAQSGEHESNRGNNPGQ